MRHSLRQFSDICHQESHRSSRSSSPNASRLYPSSRGKAAPKTGVQPRASCAISDACSSRLCWSPANRQVPPCTLPEKALLGPGSLDFKHFDEHWLRPAHQKVLGRQHSRPDKQEAFQALHGLTTPCAFCAPSHAGTAPGTRGRSPAASSMPAPAARACAVVQLIRVSRLLVGMPIVEARDAQPGRVCARRTCSLSTSNTSPPRMWKAIVGAATLRSAARRLRSIQSHTHLRYHHACRSNEPCILTAPTLWQHQQLRSTVHMRIPGTGNRVQLLRARTRCTPIRSRL